MKLMETIFDKTIQNIDDPFFQPKDIMKREEAVIKKNETILSRIKLGLKNIKWDYRNEKWGSKEEKLFLELFSKFHLQKIDIELYKEIVLKNKNDEEVCFLDLKNNSFWISKDDIWDIIRTEFNWNYKEIKSFMEQMLNEHFKLYEFRLKFLTYIRGL